MRKNVTFHLVALAASAIASVGMGVTFDRVASAATKVPARSSLHAPVRTRVAPSSAPRALSPLYPLPAVAALPKPCGPSQPPGARFPLVPLEMPQVRGLAVAAASSTRQVDLSAITGKGIWVTDFPDDQVDVAQIVALASADGLHSLWIRVGSTSDGFYGGSILKALVPLAHAAGLSVIAWDFPTLANPVADAQRASQAFQAGADAFSPDIETSNEGTDLTVPRVTRYLSRVRAIAGDKPVIATVPRPTAAYLSTYPYVAEAPFVDAFAPMVYWSCTAPGAAVRSAVAVLSHLRPVVPIGQDYNMASEGGRVGLPSGPEIWSFLDVAHSSGAIGASLYDLESGGPVQLRAIGGYPWAPAGAVDAGPSRSTPTVPPLLVSSAHTRSPSM